MEYSKIMEAIEKQLINALGDIEKAKTLEEKALLSSIIKNMSESLNIFSTIPGSGFQANDIDDDIKDEINNALHENFG